MFEYFPNNYPWNLAVVATLNSGGRIDDVDRACKPILKASTGQEDSGTGSLFDSWSSVAQSLVDRAEHEERDGLRFGAAQNYYLASLYTSQAERLQSPSWSGRDAAYSESMRLLHKHIELSDTPVTRVEIPFEDVMLPAYLFRADPAHTGGPIVIQWNGLDSTKEQMYYSGFAHELARRGISTLMVDTPGTGEALRLRGLISRFDSEVWAAACIDYIEALNEFDAERTGLVGWSLGGYYAPRAAAFEERVKLVVAWGANHNWGEVQKRRQRREGENPVPHYWDHVRWVWGAESTEDFMKIAEAVTLDGVVERITVPFLVTHGVLDRQIPVEYAHQSYDQAVNSQDRELRIFTPEEGGAEHVGLDNLPYVSQFVADWIAKRFMADAAF